MVKRKGKFTKSNLIELLVPVLKRDGLIRLDIGTFQLVERGNYRIKPRVGTDKEMKPVKPYTAIVFRASRRMKDMFRVV